MVEKCDLETIVDSFEALDNHDDKLSYIDNMLNSCGICDTPAIPISKPVKKPKKTSGWICYNKVCAEETKRPYMTCVADKERAKTEYYGMKDYWKQQSLKGCPMEVPKKQPNLNRLPEPPISKYPTLE